MTFTPEVYEQIRAGAQRSAAVIVPLVRALFEPRTVVDVGCGEGWFALAFADAGCKVVAIDEAASERTVWVDEVEGAGGSVEFRRADLTGDAWASKSLESDLAVCLEVAEHLPPGAADAFVGTLCALAPLVLFSAAIPGQGGHGHVNEQPPSYWVERFEANGFEVSGALRWQIWGSNAEPWYQQNLLVAVARDQLTNDMARNYGYHELFGPEAFSEPIYVVHPTTFAYWVEIARARRGA